MKYAGKEITSLWDNELIGAYKWCCDQESVRAEAAKHDKFNVDTKVNGKITKPRMKFPDVNPAFVKMKNEIMKEISNRKLTI